MFLTTSVQSIRQFPAVGCGCTGRRFEMRLHKYDTKQKEATCETYTVAQLLLENRSRGNEGSQ